MKRLCLSVALTLGAALLPSPARGQTPPASETLSAEARFQRGVTLYNDGDFAQALLEFRRAYQSSPDFRVLYNIGLTEFQMGDYAAAYRTLSRYLSEGGAAVPEDRKRTVTAELQKLELRVGKLEIVVDVEGAQLTIDDVSQGTSPPPSPILVTAGARRVVARLGERTATEVVEVAGGETRRVVLRLPAPASKEASPPGPVAPALPASPPRVEPARASWTWVPWTLAGAFAAGATVTGVLALGAADDLETERGELGSTSADREKLGDRAGALALTTDLLIVGAAACAGVGLYLTFGGGESDSARSAPTVLRAGPGSLHVQGTF